MKVLYLSGWFPYPQDNGARIRTHNLMKGLSRRHQVFLVSLLQEDSKREDADRLGELCKVLSLHEARRFDPSTLRSFASFFSRRPRWIADTFDPRVKRAVRDAIEGIRPDAVVVSPVDEIEYIPLDLGVPLILDALDCEYVRLKNNADQEGSPLRRLRLNMGWRKCARWEAAMWPRFAGISVASEEETRRMMAICPGLRNVFVVPSGVDTEHYSTCARSPEKDSLIYNGALTYYINLDAVRYFAAEVYPALCGRVPNVKLRVTGRTSGVDLRGMEHCPGIEFTGYVDDIRDVLNKSAVCVLPLRQGGAPRLKVFEAMGAGVPIVSTSKGVDGIAVVDGEHLLIADGPREFAEAVERVLGDPDLAGSLAANARKLVEERYSWKTIGDSFADLVERAVAERKTS